MLLLILQKEMALVHISILYLVETNTQPELFPRGRTGLTTTRGVFQWQLILYRW